MGMTISEKILAYHAGEEIVEPGQLIVAKADKVLANDITGPLAIEALENMGYEKPFAGDKVILVMDHFTPNSNVRAAKQCKICRDFAKKNALKHFYDVGEMGIAHALLPEKGLVMPGDLIIGGDSHTCTYGALGAFSTGMGSTDLAAGMSTGEIWLKVPASIKFNYSGKLKKYITGKDLILYTLGQIGVDGALYKSMEFCGDAIRQLSVAGRMTMCNMSIEAGAKNGIIETDEITLKYIEEVKGLNDIKIYKSDLDAEYEMEYEFDIEKLQPQVACPHLPSNVKNAADLSRITIDQVVIGSCTNGRLEDLKLAADMIKGRKIHPYVRTIVIPATQKIYKDALRAGIIEAFLDAGAVVSTPTCGPCFGGHMGILAAGERCISTTNRNFAGRMGAEGSEVYLSNPAVAMASAIKGRITSPEEAL